MQIVKIKPLSVNKCFQGRRFKTPTYKAYETELLYKLPHLNIKPKTPLRLTIIVGFSNRKSDLDNICKPFQDILQKKYGFNDDMIYQLIMLKKIVKRGHEYIKFRIDML